MKAPDADKNDDSVLEDQLLSRVKDQNASKNLINSSFIKDASLEVPSSNLVYVRLIIYYYLNKDFPNPKLIL